MADPLRNYLIHATFAIKAASASDAELAIRRALLDDDLAVSWTCRRTWWTGRIAQPFHTRPLREDS